MSEKIVHLNEEVIKGQIKELVRGSVEETLNEMLEAEAEKLTQAARYERNEARQGYRSGHYDRNLTTTSGEVTGNLDTENSELVFYLLHRLAHEKGYCVIVVTHDLSIADKAGEVLKLKDGLLIKEA